MSKGNKKLIPFLKRATLKNGENELRLLTVKPSTVSSPGYVIVIHFQFYFGLNGIQQLFKSCLKNYVKRCRTMTLEKEKKCNINQSRKLVDEATCWYLK